METSWIGGRWASKLCAYCWRCTLPCQVRESTNTQIITWLPLDLLDAGFTLISADHVVLNRGNHEDYAVCAAYGFQNECLEKYDEVIFGMFVELFQYLPLFAIINEAVLVLHGGLFHDTDVTLADLDAIQRNSFSLSEFVSGEDGEKVEPIPKDDRDAHLRQLQRDALWSDPAVIVGTGQSPRGAGVAFGADVTRKFLERNGLKMIVRSHECVRMGFSQPFPGEDASILCTVFSASNYGGAGNSGAFMRFATNMMYGATAVPGCELFYTVQYYDYAPAAHSTKELASSLSIRELILRKRPALLLAFEAKDMDRTGLVSKANWAEIMQRVTQCRLHWQVMIPVLVLPHHIQDDMIQYTNFLGSLGKPPRSLTIQTPDMIDALYKHHQKLESVFYFFDSEGTGHIPRASFRQSCELLNKTLPKDRQLTDVDEVLELMDMDQSGGIDINEFFEIFRMAVLGNKSALSQICIDETGSNASTDTTSGRRSSITSSVRCDNDVADDVASPTLQLAAPPVVVEL